MNRYISMMCVVGILSLLLAGCALFKKEPPEVKETGLMKIGLQQFGGWYSGKYFISPSGAAHQNLQVWTRCL